MPPGAGSHQPVLVEAAMEALRPSGDGVYMDLTFGRGGHARALLSRLGPGGRVIALDRDPAALAEGQRLADTDARLQLVRSRFSSLEAVASSRGVSGKVNGVLMDLGVSSPQLEDPARGFSFLREGPLDMRMDPEEGESAAAWLNRAAADEIATVLYCFGEERHSRRIARAICERRRRAPVRTTRELVDIVARALPRPPRRKGRKVPTEKHPATRTFQAIRIFINEELQELQAGLEQSLRVLAPGGRLVTISFHSLEDRVVKRFMRAMSKPPDSTAAPQPAFKLIGRTVRPGEEEIRANPRSRSAVMRVAERLA